MKPLLCFVIVVLFVTDLFGFRMHLGPGLSIKNAMIYGVFMLMALRTALGKKTIIELPMLHGIFVAMIALAVISATIVLVVVRYSGYDIADAIISLKARLIDQFLFFIVFFYAFQTADEAMAVARVLLLCVVTTTAIVVLDGHGFLPLGVTETWRGRTWGLLPGPNEWGSYVAAMLPAILAAGSGTIGLQRAFWRAAVLWSAMAVMMTSSRGALAGLVLGIFATAFAFRRYLTPKRVGLSVIVAVSVIALALLLAGEKYRENFLHRVFVSSAVDPSSGRGEIWTMALEKMLREPWTLLTGYGWNAYASIGLWVAPHNEYLRWFFNLGLVGVAMFVTLQASVCATALRASRVATGPQRAAMIALFASQATVSASVMFSELSDGWLYYWAYAGLMLRVAASQRSPAPSTVPAVKVQPGVSEPRMRPRASERRDALTRQRP